PRLLQEHQPAALRRRPPLRRQPNGRLPAPGTRAAAPPAPRPGISGPGYDRPDLAAALPDRRAAVLLLNSSDSAIAMAWINPNNRLLTARTFAIGAVWR